MINVVEKVWGREEWIVNNDRYCGKRMSLLPRARCSLHRHPVKRETFFVVEGQIMLEVGILIFYLGVGLSYTIEPGVLHRFSSPQGAIFFEFSSPHDDNDVERVEPSRGPDA